MHGEDNILRIGQGHTKSTKSRYCDIYMRFKNILKRQRCRGSMIEETEKEFKRI